jgi:hypothetical protein
MSHESVTIPVFYSCDGCSEFALLVRVQFLTSRLHTVRTFGLLTVVLRLT